MGSSPRVWGQGVAVAGDTVTLGIIPTRVGTRDRIFSEEEVDEDHPHACGDKEESLKSEPLMLGSSPRVWGQEL